MAPSADYADNGELSEEEGIMKKEKQNAM